MVWTNYTGCECYCKGGEEKENNLSLAIKSPNNLYHGYYGENCLEKWFFKDSISLKGTYKMIWNNYYILTFNTWF